MYAHGTYAKYSLEACHCTPCRAAGTAYKNNRNRGIAYGTWQPFVDAEPARQHIKHLRNNGLGIRRIAELSGVNPRQLDWLANGQPGHPPIRRIRTHNARRILAVQATPNNLAPSAITNGTGTVRRLQALIYCGWSQSKLADRLGLTLKSLRAIIQTGRVTARTAQRVRGLYDELWDQAPPEATGPDRAAASRARNYARARGWVSPLAWDDDLIDDADARPDLGEQTPTVVAHLENLNELTALGVTPDRIAERLGVTRSYLTELRRRARAKEAAA